MILSKLSTSGSSAAVVSATAGLGRFSVRGALVRTSADDFAEGPFEEAFGRRFPFCPDLALFEFTQVLE